MRPAISHESLRNLENAGRSPDLRLEFGLRLPRNFASDIENQCRLQWRGRAGFSTRFPFQFPKESPVLLEQQILASRLKSGQTLLVNQNKNET